MPDALPLCVLLAGVALHIDAACAADTWVGAWGFPPINFAPASTQTPSNSPPLVDFDNVTVRQIVRISNDARRVRVRFSNEFGSAPLELDHANLALAGAAGEILPGSDHPLLFNGHAAAVIPAGAPLLSDPVDWPLSALSRLAVSAHLPTATVPPAHRVSEYVSGAGNYVGAEQMDGAQQLRSGALVSGIETAGGNARRAIVTLGDSITEGHGSTPNEFRSWPDRLAERLQAQASTRVYSVVNAGINSNRLLHNNPGMGALTRFDRDVLGVPGASVVVLLEGINDIGYSHMFPEQAVTAEEIIGAYRQLIERAHAHGIGIIAATLAPFEDSHYYTPEGESLRQAVNAFIRAGGAFDGVIDFDAILRDPAHPARVNPDLTLPDHLHPNDAGYAAMAQAIDLKRLAAVAQRYAVKN